MESMTINDSDKTGEIDVTGNLILPEEKLSSESNEDYGNDGDEELEDDESVDEEYDDEINEEELSKKELILNKIKEQLPFLSKILQRKGQKFKQSNNEDADEEGDEEDNDSESDDLEDSHEATITEVESSSKLLGKIPFLLGIFNKLKSKIRKNRPSEGEDAESDDEDDSETGSNKKKGKIKPIHAVIILLVVVLVLFSDEEEGPSKVTPKKNITSKAPKKKKEMKKSELEVSGDKGNTNNVVDKTSKDKPEQEIINENEAAGDDNPLPLEEVSIDDLPESNTNKAASDQDKEVVAENKEAQELDDLFNEELEETSVDKEVENTTQPDNSNVTRNSTRVDSVEDVMPETSVDEVLEVNEDSKKISENENLPIKEKSSEPAFHSEVVLGDELETELLKVDDVSSSISSEILDKLEAKTRALKEKQLIEKAKVPTDPPRYLNPGQGLVYNCVDGHWACIESTDYLTCQNNYAWNKKEDLTIECYPHEYYESEEECIAIQRFKVDSASKTKFCK